MEAISHYIYTFGRMELLKREIISCRRYSTIRRFYFGPIVRHLWRKFKIYLIILEQGTGQYAYIVGRYEWWKIYCHFLFVDVIHKIARTEFHRSMVLYQALQLGSKKFYNEHKGSEQTLEQVKIAREMYGRALFKLTVNIGIYIWHWFAIQFAFSSIWITNFSGFNF